MTKLRRVTVFGASGFIGRHVVKRLAERGAVVAAVCRHDAPFLQPMGDVGQIAILRGSVTDADLVERAVADADAVINLVGILAEAGAQRFEALQYRAAGTIARATARAGARRLVQLSAIGADAESRSHYARTKGLGEHAAQAAFPGVTILRPSIVFGPEDQFFNRFGEMACTTGLVPLIGGGRTLYQPVYVGDVADAVMAALDRPEAAGRIYELGGPEVLSFRRLMEIMLDEIRRPHRQLVTLPFPLARLIAAFAQFLPGTPLTPDQVRLLRSDNIVRGALPTLHDLGITPTPLFAVLPQYLALYRGNRRARNLDESVW